MSAVAHTGSTSGGVTDSIVRESSRKNKPQSAADECRVVDIVSLLVIFR